MKKQFKVAILALIFGTFTVHAQNQNSFISINDNMVLNSSSDLKGFVDKKARKISKRNAEELNKYIEVLNLYHNSSVSFYNLNETQKAEFLNASATLSDKLGSMRKAEAKKLAQQVKLNKMIFEFIWASKNNPVVDTEIVELPAVSVPETSL
jgi:Skp family chaperone for outer membrane proteins